jgi:hypothetical protein
MTKNIPYLLFIIPIVVAFAFFQVYAINTPWFDDIEALPAFVLDYEKAISWSDRLTLLLKPNNEHRILYTKLITLLSLSIFGKINYVFLMFVGNMSIIGILLLYWQVFKSKALSIWYFVPIPFLLFQPHYHLLSYWALTSLQHQPTVFLVTWAMYCLSKRHWQTDLWAVICLSIATASMSNGMFGWIGGLAIICLQGRWRLSIAWLALSILAIWLYFRGFTTQGNEAGILYLKQFPHKTILAFFAFVGGTLDFLPPRLEPYRYILPICMGIILSVWWLRWFYINLFLRLYQIHWKGIWEGLGLDTTQLFVIGTFTYLLLNALVVALLRPRFGFSVLVVSNYKLYPTIFLSLGYLAYIMGQKSIFKQVKIATWGVVSICMAVLFNGICYARFLPDIEGRAKGLLAGAYNQEHNGVGLGGMVGTKLHSYIDSVMDKTVHNGVYTYPKTFADIVWRASQTVPPFTIEETPTSFNVKINDTVNDTFLVLKIGNQIYLNPIISIPYQGKNPFKLGKGSISYIQKSMLNKGKYTIGIIKKSQFGEKGLWIGSLSTSEISFDNRP